MGIDNVRCCRPRQQKTNLCRIEAAERYEVRAGLANEPAEADLAREMMDDLSERRCGNGDAKAAFGGARDERQYPAVVFVYGDQGAGIERDAAHAARLVPWPLRGDLGERRASAQARSFCFSGPPVRRSVVSSISCQPAASKRATPRACGTKAETLEELPALTISRTWVS